MIASESSSQPVMAAAQQALSRYADWIGPLPMTRLTIVELPGHVDLSSAAYPGIAVTRVRWLTGRREFALDRDMAAAIARQYAVTLASRASADAWFAEGLAAYLATRPMELRFDPRPALTPRYFGGFVPHSIRAISASAIDPRPSPSDLAEFFEPAGAPWHLSRGADRSRAQRFAIALHSLERFIGWPALQAMVRAFMQHHEAGTSLLDQFVAVATAQRGHDMSWFFEQALRMDARIDYAVVNLASAEATAGWQTTIDVRRLGEATFRAVPVVIRFADGSEITEWIDGRERERQFQYSSASQATLASVDPDAILLLDADRTNNTRTVHPPLNGAGLRLALNWLSWLQDAMLACTAVI